MTDEGLEGGFSSAEFHPDGVLLGTGTEEGLVRVWDVKGQKVCADLYVNLCKSESGFGVQGLGLELELAPTACPCFGH